MMQRQHLLIDGDDTLWENNIFFERAIAAFIAFLDHSTLTHAEVRAVIDEIEKTAGYGSANFARSLEAAYHHLVEREVSADDLARVHGFAEAIRQHPMEMLVGVEETLAYLAPRHELILLTKGDVDEQQMKIDASGLVGYFRRTIIVAEKDVATYHSLVAELTVTPDDGWMIGNSPRSDINPALAVGLNAVFVPHPHTWRLEHEELQPIDGRQLLTLERFADLKDHF